MLSRVKKLSRRAKKKYVQSEWNVPEQSDKTGRPMTSPGVYNVDLNKIATQVSLDVTSIPEAVSMARGAVRAGIDWLEAGTPLILAEGVRSVQALRKEFPNHPIVADLKTMDGGGLEAEMMFDAGATFVVVMSQAHWATVKEVVAASRKKRGKAMADVLNATDKVKAAEHMEELGVDYVIAHLGFDERRHVTGLSALDNLEEIVEAVNIPVQAVGGLSIEQAIESLRLGAKSIVIGAPLAIAADRFATTEEFEGILREVVNRVAGFKGER
jgi:3-hexulose-6-phosphate synthase/6-phospho-3-hexuloisomerase